MKSKEKIQNIIKNLHEKGEVILGKYDPVFKLLIYKSKNITAFVISEITKIKYDYIRKNLVFRNNEMYKNHALDKLKNTDILVEVKENLINLEMSTNNYPGNLQKDTEYAYNLVSNQRKIDDKYNSTRRTIQIRFDSKNMFPNDERIITEFKMRDETGNIVLDPYLTIYHINMEKIMEMYYTNKELSKFEKFLVMLQVSKKEELIKLAGKDKDLMEVEKNLEEFSSNEDVIDTYDREYAEKRAMAINLMHAENEGIAKGTNKRNIEIAKNMLADNQDISKIIKYTGLTEEEINSLKD